MTMIEYLFCNYSKVTHEEVLQKEAEVIATSWYLYDPIALLTRPIENS